MSNILSKSQILQAVDIKTSEVAVPEWGGDVLVREFSGADRDAFESSMVRINAEGQRETDLSNMRAKLVAMCLVDHETGERMFSDAELALLGKKSAAALQRVFEVAQRLNGLSADDVKDAEKNSATGPSAGSTSD
jgi:hypothetical protein